MSGCSTAWLRKQAVAAVCGTYAVGHCPTRLSHAVPRLCITSPRWRLLSSQPRHHWPPDRFLPQPLLLNRSHHPGPAGKSPFAPVYDFVRCSGLSACLLRLAGVNTRTCGRGLLSPPSNHHHCHGWPECSNARCDSCAASCCTADSHAVAAVAVLAGLWTRPCLLAICALCSTTRRPCSPLRTATPGGRSGALPLHTRLLPGCRCAGGARRSQGSAGGPG